MPVEKVKSMELNVSNTSFSNSSNDETYSLPRLLQFLLILTVNIPSTVCSFFLLYHLLTKSSLRKLIHFHMVIVLLFAILFVQLIDMPLYLKYLALDYVWPQTIAMCFTWWYIDIAFYDTIVILLAWTSFERHILIFHKQVVSTRRKRWLFHYFPMIFFVTYPLAFYLIALLTPSCDDKYLFDFTQGWCNYNPCYYANDALNVYDTLMNAAIPCLLIALFSTGLLIRILWKKFARFHRPIQWRKCRKLTVQMLLMSSLFLVFNLPLLIYYLMESCESLPTDVDEQILPIFEFAANFSVLLLPCVMIFSLPKKCWTNNWQIFRPTILRTRNAIHPYPR